ncbi:GNAT family N-acetyltransferase [uncultured Paludibaculum sp.]|uniref:GNAT family N-acetyltransferase n=1 Tax=uncultured Paludibaculum sp. TaxID=1765020 RepID=UPI002AAB592F|nr:GNAT family N-acetyltransferase [uncultured Paludibaculum sp.]
MPEVVVDLALDSDLEWCARLMAESDPWLTLGRGFETCLARCRGPEFHVLMARESGQPLGFLLLHPTGVAGSPYIAAIATSASVRGRGIGSMLLDAAEQWIPAARHIFLCVSSFNTRARQLYERRGYTQAGEFPDYVIQGASEILMHKRLVRP